MVLIFAPHPDDEVLACGSILLYTFRAGEEVRIIYVTNGDYHGRSEASQRWEESRDALRMIGLDESHMIPLGYGDTGGMHQNKSFLLKLLHATNGTLQSTPQSAETWHPHGLQEFHFLKYNSHAPYTHHALVTDIHSLLTEFKPQHLFIPHPLDRHGDHSALFHFLRLTIEELNNSKQLTSNVLCYLIHGGDDTVWPNRAENVFDIPPVLKQLVNHWHARVSIPCTQAAMNIKRRMVRKFQSQCPENDDGFMYAFCKQEEIFWTLESVNRQT